MKIVGQRSYLSEVINRFRDENLGDPVTVLRCLRDGDLVAHIEFPSYLPQIVPVPRSVWDETKLKDLYLLDPVRRNQTIKEFTVSAEFARKRELARLGTLGLAVAHRDMSILDPQYLNALKHKEIVVD